MIYRLERVDFTQQNSGENVGEHRRVWVNWHLFGIGMLCFNMISYHLALNRFSDPLAVQRVSKSAWVSLLKRENQKLLCGCGGSYFADPLLWAQPFSICVFPDAMIIVPSPLGFPWNTRKNQRRVKNQWLDSSSDLTCPVAKITWDGDCPGGS